MLRLNRCSAAAREAAAGLALGSIPGPVRYEPPLKFNEGYNQFTSNKRQALPDNCYYQASAFEFFAMKQDIVPS